MNISALTARQFRNLTGAGGLLTFEPGEGVNLIVGRNAQGKTNLLEALWSFTGARSFRGAPGKEMVALGTEQADITVEFTAQNRQQTASLRFFSGGQAERRKPLTLNGIEHATAASMAGHFCAIAFAPGHLSLVRDGPEGRRRFLDAAYCQMRPGYISVAAAYTRTLMQRNAFLRQMAESGAERDAGLLDVWDRRLADAGARIMLARIALLRRLRPAAARIYDGLSGGDEALALEYRLTPGITPGGAEEMARQLEDILRANRRRDMAAGYTTTGPHREDLELAVVSGGQALPARPFGSQGQQRSAVLALKLAEAAVLREVWGEHPVAFLDDVMSELDERRQDFILNHMEGWQIFITCCEPTTPLRLRGGRVFSIEKGAVCPR